MYLLYKKTKLFKKYLFSPFAGMSGTYPRDSLVYAFSCSESWCGRSERVKYTERILLFDSQRRTRRIIDERLRLLIYTNVIYLSLRAYLCLLCTDINRVGGAYMWTCTSAGPVWACDMLTLSMVSGRGEKKKNPFIFLSLLNLLPSPLWSSLWQSWVNSDCYNTQ